MKSILINKTVRIASLLILCFTSSFSFSQDGKTLFKQNCAACHKVDKSSIGPMLKGAQEKWVNAGEGELLYKWIENPAALYESGLSLMAKEVWEFSPSAMTGLPQLTKEEVDAIFVFADTPVELVSEILDNAKIDDPKEEVSVPLSIEERVIIFIIIGFLILFVWIMSNAKRTLSANPTVIEVPKVTKALTGAVDIKDEASILLDHDYDGIRELDNVLPPWWLWMFYATIVFGFVYVGIYHVFEAAPLQSEAYIIEMDTAKKEVEAYKQKMGMAIDETNVELITDEENLAKGAVIFKETCVVCHGPNAEGMSGPNLTDEYWIYGGDIKKVFNTINKGTPKGMPLQEGSLNPIEIQNVASYVLSLEYKEGKAPEGDKE